MAKKKPKNPFYILLGICGSAFGLTAIGYSVMAAVAQYDPVRGMEMMEANRGLLPFMHNHGATMLAIELVVLAVLTVLAIGTDRFWTRRSESFTKTPAEATSQPEASARQTGGALADASGYDERESDSIGRNTAT